MSGAAQPGERRFGKAPGMEPMRGWVAAVSLATLVALTLPGGMDWTVRAVAAWDVAVLILLGRPWWIIARSDAERTRERAAVEDPGRVVILAIALLTSSVSLVAATVLLRRPLDFAPAGQAGLLVGLGIVAVVGGWALMHTAFALHYARLYYADDSGGLEFAGGPPDDLDFAYFAFTIGMAVQTSDVVVSNGGMRRVVLGHGLLSFAFNTTILALMVNLLFGRFQ